MCKKLFFLCPTDYLEPMINQTYKDENYFYTSIGNSFKADFNTLLNIQELIEKYNIEQIYVVLSYENQIILDALKNQSYSEIRGLKEFYQEIQMQQENSAGVLVTKDVKFAFLSYYINKRIKELETKLAYLSNRPIKIMGKIYDKYENSFSSIYSELVCLEKHSLN